MTLSILAAYSAQQIILVILVVGAPCFIGGAIFWSRRIRRRNKKIA